jgi:manganese transport protein
VINMAMLVTAAGIFHAHGLTAMDELPKAYDALGRIAGCPRRRLLRRRVARVRTLLLFRRDDAGQVVMQGFVQRRIPLALRRAITMAPALLVIGLGVDPSTTLVLSQVTLSFGIPFALVPLVLFCRDEAIMGTLVNKPLTTAAAAAVAGLIITLNLFLLVQTLV